VGLSLKRVFLAAALFGIIATFFACKEPPVPLEVERAKAQEHELWRAGAPVYAVEEYRDYLASLRLAKDKLIRQKTRFRWFRKYQEVQADFAAVLAKGEAVLKKVQDEKSARFQDNSGQLRALRSRISRLKALSMKMNETEFIRKNLTQAEVAFKEAESLLDKENFTSLPEKLRIIGLHLTRGEEALLEILARYADDRQVEKWRKWAEETVAVSKKTGRAAILVTKLDRKLILYKKGVAKASYEIGLGKYGLSDKLYAGDEATPEGKYRIIKKNPSSRYHKALLINYPNDEDLRNFSQAKKRGLIPARAAIGGMIEIHGGGTDSLTNGCIGLENEAMDILFSEVAVGTPITIVGTLESAEEMLMSLRKS
jgi:hypothetical protein